MQESFNSHKLKVNLQYTLYSILSYADRYHQTLFMYLLIFYMLHVAYKAMVIKSVRYR